MTNQIRESFSNEFPPLIPFHSIVRTFLNALPRRAAVLARVSLVLVAVSACAPRTPVALAPLPDRPWTVLPGDEIKVRVYREPDLSGQWVVNGKGEVFVPGIGRMMAAGLTADSLTIAISGPYSKRIQDAVVDVGIVRSIPVLGQVRAPGVYTAEPATTVQQMVAKAGGIRGTSLETPTVMLQKGRDGARYELAADLRLDRVALDEGDAIVVVDPSFFERWTPWLETANRVGGLLSIVLTVMVLTKR